MEDFVKCYLKNKRNYLILGGLGFIGKSFVEYLYDNEAYEKIVIVDKIVPSIAYISSDKKDIFTGKVSNIKFV